MKSHHQHLLSSTKSKYFKFKSRLERSIASGRFDQLSKKKKNLLVAKVEKFRNQLENFGLSMRGAAVASTVTAGAILPNVASAQQGVFFEQTGGVIPFPATTNDFVMANIDGDPELEIIASTPTGGVILNGNVEDGWTSDSPGSFDYLQEAFFVGDIDGDTDVDILFANGGEGTTYFYRAINDGDGNFTDSYITSRFENHLQFVDWDSDGDIDIVTINSTNDIQILENDGVGNFTDSGSDIDLTLTMSTVDNFEFADLDGDGDLDLAFLSYYTTVPYDGSALVLENTTDAPGRPTLDPTSLNVARYQNYTRFDNISTFDMDGDGDLDLFFTRRNSPYSYAAEHNAETTPFTFSDVNVGYLNSAGSLQDAVVADFDNDGDDDLIVTGTSFTKLLRFDGTGLSSTEGDLTGDVSLINEYFSSIALGDLDGDGHADLLGVENSIAEYAYIDVSGAQRMVISMGDFSERKGAASTDLGSLVAFDKNDADIGTTDGGTVFSLVAGDGTNDADNSRFTITGTADMARLVVGATALDFETQSEYRIRINTLASGVNRVFDFILQLEDSPEAGFGTFEAFATEVDAAMYDASLADIDGDGDDDLIYKSSAGLSFIYSQTDLTQSSGTQVAYGDIVVVTDFDNDGDQDIVTNNGTDVYIYLNDGAGGFGDSYGNRLGAFGADVYELEIADFDGDGDQDILIAKSYGGEIWSNNGDRTFSNEGAIGSNTDQVEVGDIDEDGRIDFIIQDGSYTKTYLNQGGFSFSFYDQMSGGEDVQLEVADFDNDGSLDILAVGGGELNLRNGAGDGTFSIPYTSSITPLVSGASVSVGDIDGDNDLDLVFGTSEGRFATPFVTVYEKEGEYFHERQSFKGINSSFEHVVLGDVDGDDDLDFVLSGDEVRQVFENDNIAPNISGFSGRVIIDENTPVSTSLGQIQVTDENGDAVGPLTLHDGTNDNSVFTMDTDGNLTLASEIDWEVLGSDLLIEIDLADDQGNSRVGQFPMKINNLVEGGNGTFDSEEIKLFGSQLAIFFQSGDYDMDGDADLFKSTNGSSGGQELAIDVVANKPVKGSPQGDSGNANSIFQQNSGSFSDEPITGLADETQTMVFLDVDNDGDLDMVSHAGSGYLYLSLNNNGEFVYGGNFGGSIDQVDEIIVGDFDNDGLIDLGVHFEQFNSFNYYGVRTFEQDPDDGFIQQQNLYMYDGSNISSSLVSGDFEDMDIADFTGNGYPDLLVVTSNGDDMLFEGGETGFSTIPSTAISVADYGTSWLLTGDIDGDLDPDVLVVKGTLADDRLEIDVHFNDGAGTFAVNQTISTFAQGFEDLQLGDVDGDGSLDLVTASFKYNVTTYDYDIEVRTNDGNGNFTLSQTIPGVYAETIELMDVDGDDDLDIVLRKDTDGVDNNLLFAIKNENVAPTAINLSATAFDEHLGFEEEIATMTVADLNPNDDHVISLITGDGSNDEHNSFVSINGNSLRITQDVSFEDFPTLNILLSVYDGHHTFEQAVVLTVNDVNQAPTGIDLSVSAFDEGTQPGSAIATISAVDANSGDTHHFELATGDGTNDADNGSFVVDGNQLIIINESNFETKDSYSIFLHAADDEGGVNAAFTITVNDVNQLPTSIALSSTSFDEGTAVGSEIATISAIDANPGDTHTFQLSAGDGTNDADNSSFVIDGNKLIVTTASRFEDKSTYNIYLSASDEDGSVEEAIVLNVNDVNQVPTGISLSATSFDEGTAIGSEIAIISAIDANAGDTHTFELSTGDGTNDADNGSFVIDGDRLIITTASRFEDKSTYNIYLSAADSEGSVAEAIVLSVNDINQAPTGITLSAMSFDEGTAPGTSVATISAVDANAGDTHTFELVTGDGTNDADNGSFLVDGDNLVIAVNTRFETKDTYNVYLSASDDQGSINQAFTISIADVNQAPTDISLSVLTFDEGTAPGSAIATISAVDANAGDSHTFAFASGNGINDADNSSFIIDGNNLVITETSQFEIQGSYNIYLSASDTEGSVERSFTISVNDVNQAPTGITLSATSFEEGVAIGSTVATISAIDANAGDEHSFSLAAGDGTNDADNGTFVINGSSLIITENTDFTTKASYNILLSAEDDQGDTQQAFVLTLTELVDANQAPTDILASAISFDEGTAVGSVVATLSAVDADVDDSHTFSLSSGDGTNDVDNEAFILNGSDLIISQASNFETKPFYTIHLTTTDGSASFSKSLMIGVNDVNQGPTEISLSNLIIDEQLPVGTTVTSITVTDPNEGDTHTLSLVPGDGTEGQHNELFLINGAELVVVGDINVGTTPTLSILIEANDGEESFSQAFTISVTEVLGAGNEIESLLGVYPNPGNDRLEIMLDNDLRGHMGVKISDLAGRIVHAYESDKTSKKWIDRLDMTSALPGIYIIEISFGNQLFSQRWIKN